MQIHVTDNDGRSDGHLNVGEGTIPWNKFVGDLKKYGFKGAYVVESAIDPFKSIVMLKQLLS
jgi:sugar phosphate isomerase/epimerase